MGTKFPEPHRHPSQQDKQCDCSESVMTQHHRQGHRDQSGRQHEARRYEATARRGVFRHQDRHQRHETAEDQQLRCNWSSPHEHETDDGRHRDRRRGSHRVVEPHPPGIKGSDVAKKPSGQPVIPGHPQRSFPTHPLPPPKAPFDGHTIHRGQRRCRRKKPRTTRVRGFLGLGG